ncbi:hypothetical protein DPMN_113122 [Dreissena polymorpha]|uniref:Uncharacterized protein n=1 Tax=Dreissena polymorpha TaxID=45954 RepID=A0A9D4KHV1_DREPO|nr:hypothetical protein DPMN_113122 [Dreissena polymorpha]
MHTYWRETVQGRECTSLRERDCKKCDSDNLKRHMMIHTRERLYKCDTHTMIHTGERLCKYDTRERLFKYTWRYILEMDRTSVNRVAMSERRYKCEVCDASLSAIRSGKVSSPHKLTGKLLTRLR